MRMLRDANPSCGSSLFEHHSVCLSLSLPLVLCSLHLQIHLFQHPIIAYKEMGKKKHRIVCNRQTCGAIALFNIFIKRVISLWQKQKGDTWESRRVRGKDNRGEAALTQRAGSTLLASMKEEADMGEEEVVWEKESDNKWKAAGDKLLQCQLVTFLFLHIKIGVSLLLCKRLQPYCDFFFFFTVVTLQLAQLFKMGGVKL